MTSLPVVVDNADTATFDCIFGRGCEGLCCKNGRPSVSLEERATIDRVLPRALPLLRPAARKLVEAGGYLSRRTKLGQPMVRVVDGWCVFFHKGCVLHTVAAEDGSPLQYKPTQCALFPLEPDGTGDWYIRQWGVHGEKWDLFCLNPKLTPLRAVESLAGELALAATLNRGEEPKPCRDSLPTAVPERN